MNLIEQFLDASAVHESWRPLLRHCLNEVDSDYLQTLWGSDDWLPGRQNLLAAFRKDSAGLTYLLFGESPYPRRQSSVGIAFLDGAVDRLWSEKGLSTEVNRATSLRNLVKCMLVADGLLDVDDVSQQSISRLDKSALVSTIHELFDNLANAGFLMLNATPVLHESRKPVQESRYWYDFNRCLLSSVAEQCGDSRPTLVLWGKIAKTILAYEISEGYDVLVTEHPYNVSFIHNPASLGLFKRVSPLRRR